VGRPYRIREEKVEEKALETRVKRQGRGEGVCIRNEDKPRYVRGGNSVML